MCELGTQDLMLKSSGTCHLSNSRRRGNAPNPYEAPGCQEADLPYERKFFHLLVVIFRAAKSTSGTVR
jgi:hypothetical protein